MLKDVAWGIFEKTGSIESFLLYNDLKQTDVQTVQTQSKAGGADEQRPAADGYGTGN